VIFSGLISSTLLDTFITPACSGCSAAKPPNVWPDKTSTKPFDSEAGEAQFEIVAKDGKLTVYVSNHGAPVDTAGASGKLTVLVGTAKSDIDLKPAGKNLLLAAGNAPSGAKLLINVQLLGKKALQARAVMP
jgi:hypothetical protein